MQRHTFTCPGPQVHRSTCPQVHTSTLPHVHTSTTPLQLILFTCPQSLETTLYSGGEDGEQESLYLAVTVVSYCPLLFRKVNTFCVSHKKEHYNYIQEVANQHSSGVPPFVVEPPPLWFRSSPSPPDPFHFLRSRLILWDPICQGTLSGGIIACISPTCSLERW